MSNLSNAKLSGRANSPGRLKSLEYQVTSPAPREVWRELFQNDPEALPTQSPEWLDCICALRSGRDASRLYNFADGQQLLMPAVKRKGLPGMVSVQASLPDAWGWGGVIARCPVRVEELSAVFEDLARSPFLTLSICPNPRQGELWRAAQPTGVMAIPRRAHVLDLEGGFDKVWNERFTSATRNKMRKAEKLGVEVESDDTGALLPIFEELFRRSIDRFAAKQNEPRWLAHWRASQVKSLHKLQYMSQNLGDAFCVWVAWHEGVPVAATLVLSGSNVESLSGVSDKELAAPVNANDILKKFAIEKACRMRCRYFNVGETGMSEGIAKFKERLGAQPYAYNAYRLERLPVNRIDQGLRRMVKRAIGFKDV